MRRWAVVVVAGVLYLAVTGAFLLMVGWAVSSSEGGGLGLGPRVAILELDGVIIDVDDLVHEVKGFRENPMVRAVVIRINSPGGVVAPTQELYQAIRRVSRAGKPVVASLGAVAASGAYYVAVAADRIYADPGTLTGSIGVIMQLANVEGLLKKVGVDSVVVKAGTFKDIGNFARPMTEAERQLLQGLLDDVHGQFIDAVATGRHLDRDQVLQFADGRVVSGAQAKRLHMVDELGGLDDAIDGAARLAGLRMPPEIVRARRRWSLVDFLRSELGLTGQTLPLPTLPYLRTPLYLMD